MAVELLSDVDVLADFDRSRNMTLFSLAGVRLRIGDILEMPVDLADRRMLKDQVKASRKLCLSFEDPTKPLRDVLESVRTIEDFTDGMTFEQTLTQSRPWGGNFLVIDEAAARLGREDPLIGAMCRVAKSAIWETCFGTR